MVLGRTGKAVKPQNLDELIERRASFLADYQNEAYSQRYRKFIDKVRRQESGLRESSTELTEAVARYLFKLMAYKDEYEVARLYSNGEFRKALAERFKGGRVNFHLAPPLLARRDPITGHLRKRAFGPWMLTAFAMLARLRFLRGTALDIFGYSRERRRERALIEEYRSRIEGLLPPITAGKLKLAIEIASLPEHIRGFGHVKERHLAEVESRTSRTPRRLSRQPQAGATSHRRGMTASGNRIGVLIVNLGTPDGTDYLSVRRYLKEFLWDPRVVEGNRALWWILLNGVILTLRPTRSGRAYMKIWNQERNKSPLRTITRAQAAGLSARLSSLTQVTVDWAMRYGTPRIGDRLRKLKEEGHDRILLAPLYPQYSAATTASVADKAGDALRKMRWQPAMRTLPPYFDHPAYIAALAESVRRHLAGLDWKPDKILASFHGLPQSFVDKGDPYYDQCLATVRLFAAKMGLAEGELAQVFQSRFGRSEWLKPYARSTVAGLARSGMRNLVMFCPGFAADCVETLEEVAIGLAETFAENGGEHFSLVPALNDSPGSLDMLATLIRQELQGWL